MFGLPPRSGDKGEQMTVCDFVAPLGQLVTGNQFAALCCHA